MIQFGIFQNGAADLPIVETPSGVLVNGGTLDEVHQSYQRILVDQVRQGVLAEQLGYEYYFMTEHHFQPEGAEFSPNPLIAETAIAAQTKRIRLGQATNILTQWHPLRVAEQGAMLDVISGGRVEFGVGRGYQPREVEVFGWPYGSTIQDQERNRAYFEEAYQIIIKAWTQPSFSHHGEFFSIPPSYTKWNHEQTIAYFSQPNVGRSLEDVLRIGPPDQYSSGNPVVATTTVLKEISVFPRPLQRPYPQCWEPVASSRSLKWIAAHGVNGNINAIPMTRLKKIFEVYYEESEKHGWPDRLNRGKFKFGWDAERNRGLSVGPWVHILSPGDERAQIARLDRSLEMEWNYYGAFGFTAGLSDADEPPYDLHMKVSGELLRKKGTAIVGTAEQVTAAILKMKESLGAEDFLILCHFEMPGMKGEEVEEQMHRFAADVMPELRRACGAGPALPESGVSIVPNAVVQSV
ncbi:MAG: LLM class flavin-dependent oxidoreductase [Chloroflexi bacterium]|nr:LLM class flavin-dependent oxidoreductase [Chloroflexota bacterium]